MGLLWCQLSSHRGSAHHTDAIIFEEAELIVLQLRKWLASEESPKLVCRENTCPLGQLPWDSSQIVAEEEEEESEDEEDEVDYYHHDEEDLSSLLGTRSNLKSPPADTRSDNYDYYDVFGKLE